MTRSVALIPARGGSRRIPRKNVRPFLGVPAIQRTVRTIAEARAFDRIIVSTDDDEIASLAVAAGAEVPGIRPSELSGDHPTTVDVVRHAIRAWAPDLAPDDHLWAVYPAALLLRSSDLADALERFDASGASFLVAIVRFSHPVERRLRVGSDGRIVADEPLALGRRTQDLAPAFHDAGQFYGGTVAAWSRSTPLEDPDSLAFELARERAVDIDEPDDWAFAEALALANLGATSRDVEARR